MPTSVNVSRKMLMDNEMFDHIVREKHSCLITLMNIIPYL
jgi:hypothetical protein